MNTLSIPPVQFLCSEEIKQQFIAENYKCRVYKVVLKDYPIREGYTPKAGVYRSVRVPSINYPLNTLIISKRRGLLRGTWCFTSLTRAKKKLPDIAAEYLVKPENLVIIEGVASFKNSQRRQGGIRVVEKCIFLKEVTP